MRQIQYGYSADGLQVLGAPTAPETALPRAKRGQRGRITPCQIRRAGRLAACLVELLCEAAVRGRVL